jgi:FkbM family methyltransferase
MAYPRTILRFLPPQLRVSIFYRFFFKGASSREKLFRHAPLSFLPHMKMDLSTHDQSHQQIAYTGFFELHLSKIFMELANKGGLFVDVGANYGYYSLLWAGVSRANKVVAFEAVEENADALAHNAKINSVENHIQVENKALGKFHETMNFDLMESSQTTWGGLTQSKDSGFEVTVHRLDEFLAEDSLIDVLKIDVEGADTWVLYGAERLLKRKRIRNVFFEENSERQKQLGIKPNEVKEFLGDMGYLVENLNDNSSGVSEFHARPKD